MNVGELMVTRLITVAMDDRLRDARDKLEHHGIHHLLVLDEGKLVGVLSDRDLLRAMSPFVGHLAERPQDEETLERRVHQLMSRDLVTARPSDDVRDAVLRMLDARISCLPVLGERHELVGIITTRDVLRALVRTGSTARPSPRPRPARSLTPR